MTPRERDMLMKFISDENKELEKRFQKGQDK